jgi:hypothetical protein
MSSLVTVAPKLSKLIPLLGSDQPGEVVAAATAIHRTLQSAGCDFHDLVAMIESPPAAAGRSRQDFDSGPRGNLQRIAECCLHYTGVLSPKEASFVRQMHATIFLGRNISTKQRSWLESIYIKLQRFT